MAVAPPSYCFVALPSATQGGHLIFGKNSARPRDEVQEVVYFPAATHEAGSKVECTYITIDQVQKTYAVILSRPAWLWGAEMGANEHGVCIANEAVTAKEPAAETEALLGMDLVRLGLERGTTAAEALDTIVSLLDKHGQGGNYCEDGSMCHAFHSTFLIMDRTEAWVLETVGKYWAAEKVTGGIRCICNQLSIATKIDSEHPDVRSYAQDQGWWDGQGDFSFSAAFSQPGESLNRCCSAKEALEKGAGSITVHTVLDVLRDKNSGTCVDSDTFLTTASMVSVLPQNLNSSCIHFFTATPDPARSVFKPFIFSSDVKAVPKVQSPTFGQEDPAKKEPRFQTKVDRRHDLYKSHQKALTVLKSEKDHGQSLMETMLGLEKQSLEAMEDVLSRTEPLDPAEAADLFFDCVDTEIKFYN